MERIDAVLRPLGLTFARYEVLRLLSFSSAGAMPMTRLGSLLQVHPTSVTSAVDRLEQAGVRRRRRHDDDRRVVLASITEAGRAVSRAGDGRAQHRGLRGSPGCPPADVAALTACSAWRAGAGDDVSPDLAR